MSDMVGVHWDSLSGLMDIPHSEREEIRVNYAKYPSFSSKAEQIFTHFNGSKGFDRHILQKYFKELGRHDLKNEMLPVENEVFHEVIISLVPRPKCHSSPVHLVPSNI
jgi:hypothetical protein